MEDFSDSLLNGPCHSPQKVFELFPALLRPRKSVCKGGDRDTEAEAETEIDTGIDTGTDTDIDTDIDTDTGSRHTRGGEKSERNGQRERAEIVTS